MRPAARRALLLALSLAEALNAAAEGERPQYRPSLDTVAVVVDGAPVLVADKVVARAARGQWFGVRKRAAGRVAVQIVVGEHIRTGWLRKGDIRPVSDDSVDLAAEALRLTRVLRPDLQAEAYLARVDALAEQAREACRKATTPVRKVRAIAALLFRREGYRYERGVRMLDQVLDERRGNCLGLSLLTLCVARRLEMPVWLVPVPGHAYLRYDDGQAGFDIEPSMGGAIFPGGKPHHRPRGALGGVHLRLLSPAQTVGLLHADLGAALGRAGKHEAACAQFARAVELSPVIAEAYSDWGVALAHQKQWPEACDRFARAIQAHPHYAEAYYGFGSALARWGELEAACAKFARAVELRPDYAEAYFNWGSVLITLGKLADGADKLERAARLRPRLRPAVERLRRSMGRPSPPEPGGQDR